MCVEQEVRCTGCGESSTSIFICPKLKKWQLKHTKIVSHRLCPEFRKSRLRKQNSFGHFDCPTRNGRERIELDPESEDPFMYDYISGSESSSPPRSFSPFSSAYTPPYTQYPTWCV
ncbi:hypothetical protein EAF04_009191 [Stromatinia cepivora]|nr:hypothetical protein EAF04_009191 [Stromatinia cepivora]